MAQQARHDEYGDVIDRDSSLALVTMEMALSSWSAVDCRCSGWILVFLLLPVVSQCAAPFVRFNQLVFFLLLSSVQGAAQVCRIYHAQRFSNQDRAKVSPDSASCV